MLNRGGGKYYKHLTRLSSLVLFIFAYAIVITGSTYAFMSFSAMSDSVANGQGGCFNVSYTGEELNAGNILSTTNYLEGAHTTVTLSKDSTCKIYTEANIYVHTNNTTTAPIDTIHALKYKLFMEGNQISEGLITQIGDTLIATVPLTDISTTYTIYLWIDPELSNGAYHDTSYSGYIYAESAQTSTIEGKYLVSFNRGNLLYGFKSTNGTVSVPVDKNHPNTSYVDISINSNYEVTVINNGTRADAYAFVGAKIDLLAGKKYIFNCDTNGTWNSTDNSGSAEAYLMLDGEYTTWLRLNSNNNYEFTPSTSGTYFLRFDANGLDTTVTYSNITITEKESSMFTKTVTVGQEYGWLPTFEKDGYKLTNWSLNGNSIKSSTIVSENNNHTLTARWGEPYELTNLVTNGSFEDGLNNWRKAGYVDATITYHYINNDYKKYGNSSVARIASSTASKNYIAQSIPFKENHQFYYFLHGYTNSNTNQDIRGDVANRANSSIHLNVTKNNGWTRVSRIYVSSYTETREISVNFMTTTDITYVDGVGVIDLTETFGSGNEPSKEWCDENIDYFDGITTVYK